MISRGFFWGLIIYRGTKDLSILGIIHISFVRDSSFDGDLFFYLTGENMLDFIWFNYLMVGKL
jgi:hypothetical protein